MKRCCDQFNNTRAQGNQAYRPQRVHDSTPGEHGQGERQNGNRTNQRTQSQ
ncbi:MAG: hypothetical protein ACR5LF_07695 [Symbiopectobacterium sp.]